MYGFLNVLSVLVYGMLILHVESRARGCSSLAASASQYLTPSRRTPCLAPYGLRGRAPLHLRAPALRLAEPPVHCIQHLYAKYTP
jgi:hypothetical protein